MHARVAVLEAELVACRRPHLKQISVLPSTSGNQPWQNQKGLGGKCGHDKTMNGKGGKWSRQEYTEEKKTRDLNHQGSGKTISEWTLHLVYIKNLVVFSNSGFIDI